MLSQCVRCLCNTDKREFTCCVIQAASLALELETLSTLRLLITCSLHPGTFWFSTETTSCEKETIL